MRILLFIFGVVALSVSLWGCAPHQGIYHTVEPGQTLYRISRTYGVDEKQLARLNGIDDPSHLRVGQRIFVPGVSKVKSVPATVTTQPRQPAATAASPQPRPPAVSSPPPAATRPAPTLSPAPAPTTSRPSTDRAIGKGHFDWPIKGEVLSKFGQKSSGPSQGIEIAAGRGTPVRSAAAGRVIYSGDGIRGYGNLIILRHDDDFFTVYAFNERILVKEGTFVGRGEHIAAVGTPPGGGTPRLYFEVRRGKDTVDPLFFLP